MPEKDLYEHRIAKLEDDVKHLYSKVNSFAVANAEMNTKLDSVLVTLGELKAFRQSAPALQNCGISFCLPRSRR